MTYVVGRQNYCTWRWIRCDSQSRLRTLFISFNNQTGTVPEAIGQLSGLQVFGLGPSAGPASRVVEGIIHLINPDYNWEVSGSIPKSLVTLSSLKAMILLPLSAVKAKMYPWFGRSGMSGTLPVLPKALQGLVIVGTPISGSLPQNFEAVSYVGVWLDFDTSVSGTIPRSWGTNPDLRSIS